MTGKGGFGNIMKQAQMMQSRLQKLQAELGEKTMEGTAGGGMVKVTVNGKNEILSIKIDKEAVNPNDVEMLEELVLTATNQALKTMQTHVNESMKQITGGMNLPGLF